MRRIGAKNQALTDQILRVLRDADGFPLSTGQIAGSLGQHLVNYGQYRKPLNPRPPCWPADLEDPLDDGRAYCGQCRGFHRPPVWRNYQADDVRPLLKRLAKAREVEQVILDDQPRHYWRRDDSDAPLTP